MKLDLRKCSQVDVGRKATKTSGKAQSQRKWPEQLQVKKANQKNIHDSKKVWLTMPNIYGQGQQKWVSSGHYIYQLEDPQEVSFSRDKDNSSTSPDTFELSANLY